VHLFQTLVFALTILLSTTIAEAQSTSWELKREQSIYPVSPQKGLQAHVHVYLPVGSRMIGSCRIGVLCSLGAMC